MSAPNLTVRQRPHDMETAHLDLDATIIGVNEAWTRFARSNGGDPSRTGVGMSYVDVCDRAGDPVSAVVSAAIRAASQTILLAPVTVRIPCHGPGLSRFFDLGIASRVGPSGRCTGTTVTLSLVDAHDTTGAPLSPADTSGDLAAALQQKRWLETSTTMTQQIFVGHAERSLDVVLSHGAQAACADFAASITPLDGQRGSIQAVGEGGGRFAASYLHLPSTFAASVIESGRPLLLQDYGSERGDLDLFDQLQHPRRGGSRSLAGVPWISREGAIWGALVVGRRGAPFAQEDLRHLELFAADAETALTLRSTIAQRAALALATDHERIAALLHGRVTQDLFATSMGLANLASAEVRTDHRESLLALMAALDATIGRIHGAAFEVPAARTSPDPRSG